MNCTPSNTVAWGGAGLVDALPKKNPDGYLTQENSFKDLMSEELAKDLQQRLASKCIREEESLLKRTSDLHMNSSLLEDSASGDTSSDLLLALYMQREFDKEYDSQINREEKHYNKNSKLSISFSKYKVCPESIDSEEEYYHPLDDENRAFDSFEESKRSNPVIPACGYTRHNNKMVTKHDKTITGRRNAERVMNFPPGINTGDGGGFDMQISNNVYNKLARSAMSETKRKQRINDKVDKATAEKVLDPKTRLLVFKLVNNSILECVNGIVSTGKESVVFHATGGIYEEKELPSECAVKVFKTILTDFKTRERYIKDDYRFKDRISKNNTKMMIKLWAEKEFHNLRRLQKAGIPSPTPLLIKKHILIMSFIGDRQSAAPKLKHTRLSYEDWVDAYEQVVDIMTTMFRGCKLVHGDMSEYNILWFDDKCWIIDLGQAVAVEPLHPNALLFLHRDCSNVIGFFRSKGVAQLPTPLQLFEKITDIHIPGGEDEALRLIEQYEVNKELSKNLVRGSDDHFDRLWEGIEADESNKLREEYVADDLEEDGDALPEMQESPDLASESTKAKKRKPRRRKKSKDLLNLAPGDDPLEGSSDQDPPLPTQLNPDVAPEEVAEEKNVEVTSNNIIDL